jgi:hypothetical protein
MMMDQDLDDFSNWEDSLQEEEKQNQVIGTDQKND